MRQRLLKLLLRVLGIQPPTLAGKTNVRIKAWRKSEELDCDVIQISFADGACSGTVGLTVESAKVLRENLSRAIDYVDGGAA